MKHIHVWRTLCDALLFIKANMFLFLKGIAVPLFLYLVCVIVQYQIPSAQLQTSIGLSPAAISMLLEPFLALWMLNICYRLALTQNSGKPYWTMAETLTVVNLALLCLLVLVGAGLPAGVLYFALTALHVPSFVSSVPAGLCHGLLMIYLMARFSMIFPSVAIGEKLDILTSWRMTQDNAFKIMILMFLGVVVFGFVITVLFGVMQAILASHEAFMLSLFIAQMSGVAILCVNGVSLAFAYRQLK